MQILLNPNEALLKLVRSDLFKVNAKNLAPKVNLTETQLSQYFMGQKNITDKKLNVILLALSENEQREYLRLTLNIEIS